MDNTDLMLHQAACFKSRACEAEYDVALQNKRPFMLLKPKVYPDGNQWCALYGTDLQEGVAGFGNTPELAAQDFDIQWLNQKIEFKSNAKEEFMTLTEAYEIVKQNCGHDRYVSVEGEIDSLGGKYTIYDTQLSNFFTVANTLQDCVTAYLNKLEVLKLTA